MVTNSNSSWFAPKWPVATHVDAIYTDRSFGVSKGAYASLNLGLHVGDSAEDVQINRQILGINMKTRPVFLEQVHGTDLVKIDSTTPDGVRADGAYTRQRGIACTVMVADCLPLLMTDIEGTQVAAVHAGWRGLAAGVIESALQTFPNPQQVMVWLGPCIGPQAFEVGDDVRSAFLQSTPESEQYFSSQHNKWLAHLSGLARLRLLLSGVTAIYGNDGSTPWCTFSNPLRFFSHRRDRVSGRMAACIWLV